tara:strand:- start:126 stop:749 length:624 start_codon:yes stop_codon:yes gene_type:complete
MIDITKLTIIFGLIMLSLSVINGFSSDLSINNSIIRAEALACLSAVFIIGIGILYQKVESKKQQRIELKGSNGFYVDHNIAKSIKNEMAWGSQLILTATAASTILVYYDGKVILKRGLISDNTFIPGKICISAIDNSKLVNLVNTKNYPGSYEFDSIIENLPSVLIYPLGKKGVVIVGGWSPRCFTKSDELWIVGWSEKLCNEISNN